MLNYLQYKNGVLKENFLDNTPLELKGLGMTQTERERVFDSLAAFCQEEVTVYGDFEDGEFTIWAVMFNDLLLGTKETEAVAKYLKFEFSDIGDTYKINQIEKMKLEQEEPQSA